MKTATSPVQMTVKSGKQDDLLKALGISKARGVVLQKMSHKAVDKSKGRISNILLEISKECKNPNELALSVFIAGKSVGVVQTEHAFMHSLMGAAVKVSVKRKK